MTKPTPTTLDEMLEDLYNLDRYELRRLAYEALLISDGPDRIEDTDDTAADTTMHVELLDLDHEGPNVMPNFEIWQIEPNTPNTPTEGTDSHG